MTSGDGADEARGSDDPPTPPGPGPATGPSTGPDWDPDGVELAKALVARAKAGGRRRTTGTGRSASSKQRSGAGPRPAARAGWTGWSGPAADDRDPKPVGEAVKRLADEHGWEEELSVHGVIARWDQIVGPELAAHVRPESYADTVLTVRAGSTAWATQVRLIAAELVRKINQEVGHGAVTRVDVLGPQARKWTKGRRSVPGRGPRDTYG